MFYIQIWQNEEVHGGGPLNVRVRPYSSHRTSTDLKFGGGNEMTKSVFPTLCTKTNNRATNG